MKKLPPNWTICSLCRRLHWDRAEHLTVEQREEAGSSWSFWVGHTPYLAYSRWRECSDADVASRSRRLRRSGGNQRIKLEKGLEGR